MLLPSCSLTPAHLSHVQVALSGAESLQGTQVMCELENRLSSSFCFRQPPYMCCWPPSHYHTMAQKKQAPSLCCRARPTPAALQVSDCDSSVQHALLLREGDWVEAEAMTCLAIDVGQPAAACATEHLAAHQAQPIKPPTAQEVKDWPPVCKAAVRKPHMHTEEGSQSHSQSRSQSQSQSHSHSQSLLHLQSQS